MLRQSNLKNVPNTHYRSLEEQLDNNVFSIGKTVVTSPLPNGKGYVFVTDQCSYNNITTFIFKECKPVVTIYTKNQDRYKPIPGVELIAEEDDFSSYAGTPTLICSSGYSADDWICDIAWLHWMIDGNGGNTKFRKPLYGDIKIVRFNQEKIINSLWMSDIDEHIATSIVNNQCWSNCTVQVNVKDVICSRFQDDSMYIRNQPYSLSLAKNNNDLLLTTTMIASMTKDNETTLIIRYYVLLDQFFHLKELYSDCDGKLQKNFFDYTHSPFEIVREGLVQYGITLTNTISFENYYATSFYSHNTFYIQFKNHTALQQPFFRIESKGAVYTNRYNARSISFGNRIIVAFEAFSSYDYTYQTFFNEIIIDNSGHIRIANDGGPMLAMSPLASFDPNKLPPYHCINPALAISENETLLATCDLYTMTKENAGKAFKVYDFSGKEPFGNAKVSINNMYINPDFDHITYETSSLVCLEDGECIINFINNDSAINIQSLWKSIDSECALFPKLRCGSSNFEAMVAVLLMFFSLSAIAYAIVFIPKLYEYFHKKYNEYKGYFELNNPPSEDDDIEMGNVSQKISLNNLIVGERKYQLFSANQREFIKYFVLEFEKTLNFYDVIMRSDVTQYDANSEKWKTLAQAIASSHLEFPVPGFDSSYIPFKMNLPANVIVNMIFSSIALLKKAYNINQAKEVNKAFQHLSLRERIKFIYRTARFLSVYYFNKINPCKSGEQVKQSVNDAIKIIFERLLKNNMLKYCFYSYSQTLIDIDHEIKEAFPLKFSKTSNQEIFTYFEGFLQGEATADLDSSIDNQQENVITVLSKALSDEDFCRHLIDKNESELADSDKLKKYVIFTGNKLIKGRSITPEFVEALFLIDAQSCQRINRENSLALPPDNIRRFINNFTKLFYNTYALYSCLDAKTIRKKAAISREQKGAAMQALAKAVMPVIHFSGNEMGVPLPIEISLSTGIVMAAIISLCEKMQKKAEKKKNRSIVHFFGEKNLQNRVDDIDDCAAFLSAAYYTYLYSLKDNEQITLFSAFTVEKIFRYIGKERNKNKLFIEGNSVDLKHVAVCVIQRSIKKESKQDAKQHRFVGIFKNPTAQYAHPNFDYTKFKIL